MERPDAELRTQGVFSLAPHMAVKCMAVKCMAVKCMAVKCMDVKCMDVKHMNANSFPFS